MWEKSRKHIMNIGDLIRTMHGPGLVIDFIGPFIREKPDDLEVWSVLLHTGELIQHIRKKENICSKQS